MKGCLHCHRRYLTTPLSPTLPPMSPDPPVDGHDSNVSHRGEDGGNIQHGNGKQGGDDDACSVSVEQEAAATQERIRMKRNWYGELETAVRRGKDAFVSIHNLTILN